MSWKAYDFECVRCGRVFGDLVKFTEDLPEECPYCGATGAFKRLVSTPQVLSTIVPDYPGAKKRKAGYQHTHNRAAEKKETQISMSGTGGVDSGSTGR